MIRLPNSKSIDTASKLNALQGPTIIPIAN